MGRTIQGNLAWDAPLLPAPPVGLLLSCRQRGLGCRAAQLGIALSIGPRLTPLFSGVLRF